MKLGIWAYYEYIFGENLILYEEIGTGRDTPTKQYTTITKIKVLKLIVKSLYITITIRCQLITS